MEQRLTALGLVACQGGYTTGFITATGLVHQLMEARDEERLLKLQAYLASLKPLIIDELGYVPLSPTAHMPFEGGAIICDWKAPCCLTPAPEALRGKQLDDHDVHLRTSFMDEHGLQLAPRRPVAHRHGG